MVEEGKWPGNSSNLKQMKISKSIIKMELDELAVATSVADLERNIQDVWSNLDSQCLETVLRSMYVWP